MVLLFVQVRSAPLTPINEFWTKIQNLAGTWPWNICPEMTLAGTSKI